VDNSLLVRVLDGVADLHEQVQPLLGREVVLVAVVGDALAPHQLHDEIGSPRLRRPAIEHFGDVGMSAADTNPMNI